MVEVSNWVSKNLSPNMPSISSVRELSSSTEFYLVELDSNNQYSALYNTSLSLESPMKSSRPIKGELNICEFVSPKN